MGKARTPEEKDVFIASVVKWAKRIGAVLGAAGALLTPMIVMWLQVADANKQSKAAKIQTVEVKKQQDVGFEKMVLPALKELREAAAEGNEWADEINDYLDELDAERHDLEHRLLVLETKFLMKHGDIRVEVPEDDYPIGPPMSFHGSHAMSNLPERKTKAPKSASTVKLYDNLATAQQQLAD